MSNNDSRQQSAQALEPRKLYLNEELAVGVMALGEYPDGEGNARSGNGPGHPAQESSRDRQLVCKDNSGELSDAYLQRGQSSPPDAAKKEYEDKIDIIEEQDVSDMKLKYIPARGSNYASFAGREASSEAQYRQFEVNDAAGMRGQASDTVLKKKKQSLEPPIFSTNQFQGQANDQMRQESQRQDSLRQAAHSVQQMGQRYQTSREHPARVSGTSSSLREQSEAQSLYGLNNKQQTS